MVSIAQKVRLVYSGKIIFGMNDMNILPILLKNSIFRSNVDLMYQEIGTSISSSGYSQNLSVQILKDNFKINLSGYSNYLANLGINIQNFPPTIFVVQANSYYSALESDGLWVDDGGCTPDNIGGCGQNDVIPDFSVQAIYNEAVLEYLSTQTIIPVYSIDPKFYWHTDTMLPVPCNSNKFVCGFFPALSTSIRGKPSEVIFYNWFKK